MIGLIYAFPLYIHFWSLLARDASADEPITGERLNTGKCMILLIAAPST